MMVIVMVLQLLALKKMARSVILIIVVMHVNYTASFRFNYISIAIGIAAKPVK